MTARRLASMTATIALAAGAALAVLVATPSIAAVIRTAHLDDGGAVSPSRAIARPPAPSVSPPTRYRGPLVAPAGWSDVTRTQLHASFFPAGVEVRDRANASIAERQAWLVKQCMAGRGFLFDPTGDGDAVQLLPAAQRSAFLEAEYGSSPGSAVYDWRTAGCHGRAVHLTGQDDVH